MPKISVLMPVYNAEEFLREAVESILQQSFEDFEFIIIDDGSVDNSVAIIREYQDPRIRFYQNERNSGITATLNRGIELANAEFIARMDADDISYTNRLARQYAYMQAHPACAMVSSMVSVVSEDKQLIRQDRMKSEHYYYNLTFICWIYHPTVMYRKEAVQKVGMYTAKYSEDFELFWRLLRSYKIYTLPEVLLDYRVTDQSLHQVLRKNEYEQAQQQQVLRNIRFCTGESYDVPLSFIECYRHNFKPLLEERSLRRIVSCVKKLDFITECILRTENENKENAAIRKAALYKRRHIISCLSRELPKHYSIMINLLLKSPKEIMKALKSQIKSRFKTKQSTFLASFR